MNALETLNDKQSEAVLCTQGPLLILAGAGSGKTRVITNRTAYMIEECGISPWNILAITFTNKAADEMKNRIHDMVGYGADSIWVSTFHSMCSRILRRYIDRIGYDLNFTIYDSDDVKSVINEIIKRLDINTKNVSARGLMNVISQQKDELISPEMMARNCAQDYAMTDYIKVYKEYENTLKRNNALDFDDLIMKTVELFKQCPDVLLSYQERFRYIMVDEYQDTNTAQFELVRLIADKYKNICVVGDDDQSIYKFRGANIMNILGFEEHYKDAKVIRLEQNYRSTQIILDTANAVIRHNRGRKDKSLWTDKGSGERVHLRQFETGYEEAEFIASDIVRSVKSGSSTYRNNAVLYRTNAQSRLLEEKFIMFGIPYDVVGGVNFYSRREIKDVLAYLKTIDNGKDDLSVKRIINVPRRGIGATTINRATGFAESNDMSLFDAILISEHIPGIGTGKKKLDAFSGLIMSFREKAKTMSVDELIKEILDETGYLEELSYSDDPDAKDRIENIEELIGKAKAFCEVYESTGSEGGENVNSGNGLGGEGTGLAGGLDSKGSENKEGTSLLSAFLSEVALVADIDRVDDDNNRVLLMTLHGAKGLEFERVYIAGLEDGLFPSYMSISGDDEDELEEERRLCYVGITRAMEELTLTYAKTRMIRGEKRINDVSRFIREMPQMLLDNKIPEKRKSYDYDDYENFDVSGYAYSGRSSSETASFGRGSFGGYDAGRGSFGGYGAGRSNGRPNESKVSKKPFIAAFDAMSKGKDIVKADGLSYKEGDKVKHIKFGVGTVISIQDGGRDYEVTVDFERAGIKKMFAGFARLVKV